MKLTLKYSDRYQLWHDLLHANTNRLFAPTEQMFGPGEEVSVEVTLDVPNLRLVVQGTVIGCRQQSRRFLPGVYLYISEQELRKCRQILGLRTSGLEFRLGRRAIRVHLATGIKVRTRRQEFELSTINISESGLLARGTHDLHAGEQVDLSLAIGPQHIDLEADVAWVSTQQELAGLHFINVSPEAANALREQIGAVIEACHASGKKPEPILVADDDPDVLCLIRTALSKHGYDVFKATNGEEALQILRDLRPCLVLLDILMPRIDGVEVYHAMTQDAELAGIPVIFISALDGPKLHKIAEETGVADFLLKPLHLAELLDIVSYYLRHSRYRS